MSFSFAASRSPADIDETIERLLELPAEIAGDENRQIVVFVRRVPGGGRTSIRTFQRSCAPSSRSSRTSRMSTPAASAGMMRRLFNDENEPFYRSAKTMEIGPIPRPSSASSSRASSIAPIVASSDEALDRLLAITRGHPYATQELAYALWEEVPAGFSATVSDLDDALRAVLGSENARWRSSGRTRRDPRNCCFEALAREPGRPFSNPYRLRHDLPPTSGVQRALRALLEDELVRKERDGEYDLAEPFLREWILA